MSRINTKSTNNEVIKAIEAMTPVEVVLAFRSKDMKTIRALSKILIGTGKFSINELQRTLEDYDVQVNATTIGRWIKN